MSKHFLTLLTTAFLLVSVVSPAGAAPGSSPELSVVQYGDGGHPSFVVHLSSSNGSRISLTDWAASNEDRTVVSIDGEASTATVAAPRSQVFLSWLESLTGAFSDNELETLSYVEHVEPNYRVERAEPVRVLENTSGFGVGTIGFTAFDDPEYPTEGVAFDEDADRTTMADVRSQTGVDGIQGDTTNLTIAVIDTGVNTADGRIFGDGTEGSALRIHNSSKSFVSGESVNASSGDYSALKDPNGHGTWTASSIGANASGTVHDGMAPNSTLLVLKALDDDGSGETADIAAAIRYAADNDAEVISLSLGSPLYSEAIAKAVRYAQDKGSVLVVAAGNSRQLRSPGIASPGDTEGVITVGASNGSKASEAYSAYFSQVGPDPSTTDGAAAESEGAEIDVVAPGMKTVARVPTVTGALKNSSLSGTSMATPEVAGGILKAMATNSTLRNSDSSTILKAVQESATPAQHMAVAEAGHGMFNASNLATGTHPEETQHSVQTDPAKQRNQWYEAASAASGGWLASIARNAGVGA